MATTPCTSCADQRPFDGSHVDSRGSCWSSSNLYADRPFLLGIAIRYIVVVDIKEQPPGRSCLVGSFPPLTAGSQPVSSTKAEYQTEGYVFGSRSPRWCRPVPTVGTKLR